MLRFVIALFIASCCFPRSGAAQCDRDWLPGDGIPGVNGAVVGAAEFDPDGSGPQPTKLFVVGDFTVAGNQFVSGGAAWNGTSWENTGANLNAVGLQKVGEALYLAAGNSVYKWDSGWKVIAAFNSSNAPITGLYSYRGGLYVLSPSTQITPSLGYGPQSAC